jgi:hypothetical protein
MHAVLAYADCRWNVLDPQSGLHHCPTQTGKPDLTSLGRPCGDGDKACAGQMTTLMDVCEGGAGTWRNVSEHGPTGSGMAGTMARPRGR